MLKAQKLKISCRPSSNKIFYYFAPLGFGIAEYNDWPIIEKKKKKNGGGSVPENEVHCPGFVLKKLWHVCQMIQFAGTSRFKDNILNVAEMEKSLIG